VRRSKVEVYLHFVWATYERRPLLTPEIERVAYACILEEALRLHCEVLALGGTENHVHLAVRFSNTVSLGDFMQQIKGVSSRLVKHEFGEDLFFRWQEGYGVFSFSRPHRDRIVAYVQNQKHHHERGQIWPEWEQTDEEVIISPVRQNGRFMERGVSTPRNL
jgi:REP element-mobilizing transposase RayT